MSVDGGKFEKRTYVEITGGLIKLMEGTLV